MDGERYFADRRSDFIREILAHQDARFDADRMHTEARISERLGWLAVVAAVAWEPLVGVPAGLLLTHATLAGLRWSKRRRAAETHADRAAALATQYLFGTNLTAQGLEDT